MPTKKSNPTVATYLLADPQISSLAYESESYQVTDGCVELTAEQAAPFLNSGTLRLAPKPAPKPRVLEQPALDLPDEQA